MENNRKVNKIMIRLKIQIMNSSLIIKMDYHFIKIDLIWKYPKK